MFYVIYTRFIQAESTIPSQVDPDKWYVLKSAERVKYFICLVKNYCAWTHNQFGSRHISHHTDNNSPLQSCLKPLCQSEA